MIDQVLGSLLPVWEIQVEFLYPGFCWLNSGYCGHLGVESAGSSLLSVTLPFFYYLFILQRGGETERMIFRLIIHSPGGRNSWS